MDEEAKSRIRMRCAESLQQNETLRRLLPGAGPDTLRADFARCAIDLALEHHSAVIGLVLHEHYGSAAALLRPLLESAASAHWLIYVADCDCISDLERTARGESNRDIPDLDRMLKALLKTFPAAGNLWRSLQSKGPGTWLHKFTHGGVLQLQKRGVLDGWTEQEAQMHLLCADQFAVLAATVGTVIHEAPDLAGYVFPRRDALVEELVGMGLAASIEPQPNHLPEPLSDRCGRPALP